MNAEALGEELNEMVALATRGMLRYVVDSTPYLTTKTFAIWNQVRAIGDAVTAHGRALTGMLEQLEVPQRPASYSIDMGRFPFTSLESLLPCLIDEARRRVDVNERAAALAEEDEALRRQLDSMLEENRAHLEKMQAFQLKLAAPDADRAVSPQS